MTYTFRKVGGFFAIHDLTSLLDTQYHRALYCTNMIIPQNSCIINDHRAVSTIIMHYCCPSSPLPQRGGEEPGSKLAAGFFLVLVGAFFLRRQVCTVSRDDHVL